MKPVKRRWCGKHGFTLMSKRMDGYGGWRCRKCSTESVLLFRRKLKTKAIAYLGGKCQKCGYKKNPYAFDFHHRNPKHKDFTFGHKGCTRSWGRVKKELDKCTLLCANCHREWHSKDY